jgi:hypothetical protein
VTEAFVPDDEVVPFSDQLEAWLGSDATKTVGALGEFFAEKSFAVTVLVLMFIPALPLPTGGLPIFEIITMTVSLQMVVGRRTLWLPARWCRRPLGDRTLEKGMPFIARRIRWFERFSRPRAVWFFERRPTRSLVGLVITAFALGATLTPPLSGLDTLPSMGAVVVALSVILDDIVVFVIGVVIGTTGVVLAITLGAAAVRLVQEVF